KSSVNNLPFPSASRNCCIHGNTRKHIFYPNKRRLRDSGPSKFASLGHVFPRFPLLTFDERGTICWLLLACSIRHSSGRLGRVYVATHVAGVVQRRTRRICSQKVAV